MRFLDVTKNKSKNIIIRNNLSIAKSSIDAKRNSINVLSIISLRKLYRNINSVKKLRGFRSRDKFF